MKVYGAIRAHGVLHRDVDTRHVRLILRDGRTDGGDDTVRAAVFDFADAERRRDGESWQAAVVMEMERTRDMVQIRAHHVLGRHTCTMTRGTAKTHLCVDECVE